MFRTVRALAAVLAAAAGITAATCGSGEAATRAATPAAARAAAPAAAPAGPMEARSLLVGTNTIWNYSDVGLGIIQEWDHRYLDSHWDVILPAQQRLSGGGSIVSDSNGYYGWWVTAGFYIGPGYCADLWRHDFGMAGPWSHQGYIGPGEHPIGSNTSYKVYVFRSYSGAC